MKSRILVGGHRGMGQTDDTLNRARAVTHRLPSENSLASFYKAFANGADYVELDLLSSLDNMLFVSHSSDADLHRPPFKAIGQTNLCALSWQELQKLRFGYDQNVQLSSLVDILTLAAQNQKTVNIELKDVKGTAFAKNGASLIDLLATINSSCPIWLSSFAQSDLVEAKGKLPAIKVGRLFDCPEKEQRLIYPSGDNSLYQPLTLQSLQEALNASPLDAIHPEIKSITPPYCDKKALELAVARGLEIHVWFINETRPQIHQANQWLTYLEETGFKTIGIITNYTQEWRHIVDARATPAHNMSLEL